MSSGNNPLVVYDGATTGMSPDIQGDLIGDGMFLAGVATHNLIIIFIIDGEGNWIMKIFREDFIVGETGTNIHHFFAVGIHEIFGELRGVPLRDLHLIHISHRMASQPVLYE